MLFPNMPYQSDRRSKSVSPVTFPVSVFIAMSLYHMQTSYHIIIIVKSLHGPGTKSSVSSADVLGHSLFTSWETSQQHLAGVQ